jgi:hypothetical protein
MPIAAVASTAAAFEYVVMVVESGGQPVIVTVYPVTAQFANHMTYLA